jgi:uncharacterized membrane protein required for colicin V production
MCEGLILPLGSVLSNLSGGNRVDICCAVLALFSIGLGSHRGLSAEMPLGVGWFSGILSAWYAYAPVHSLCGELPFMQDEPEFLLVLSTVTVALLAWGVAVLVSRGLRLLAVHVEKTPADYALGTVVGVVRAFVLLLIVTAIMLSQSWWGTGREVFCHQSWTGQVFTPWASGLLATIEKLKPHVEIHRRTDDPGDLSGK